MKIIYIANTDWFLYNMRLAQIKYIHAHGFEVVLVSPEGKYISDFQAEGFRWLNWEVGRKSTRLISEIRSIVSLYKIYKNEKPNYVHHFTIKPVLYGTIAARLQGVKGIINSIPGRGYVFLSDEPMARILRPIVSAMYRSLMKHTQIIFENSADRAYFLDNHFALQEQTHLIPGAGADPDRFVYTPEPPGIPVILYAGRLLWDKGLGELVEAGRILRRKEIAFRLTIAGEPDPGNPSSVPIETLKEWERSGDVEWLGFQKNIEETIRQSHIVALPSYYGEGVPTILIEAAASGRPIIASDIAGCREVVQDGINGLIVPVRDPDALAESLGKLICDRTVRHRMGVAGRKIFLENLTHDIVNQQTLEVYLKSIPAKQ